MIETRNCWIERARRVIQNNYGVVVSDNAKDKDLLTFGRSEAIGTTPATVAIQPAGILDETYVDDNLITQISSSNAGDTQEVVIEGLTLSGGNFTFVVQTVALNGQNAVNLPTPIARSNRAYNNGSTNLLGSIYVAETVALTAGVPDDATKVHLMIDAGHNNSEKAATTISSVDFWAITTVQCFLLQKTAAVADLRIEVREYGKVFLELAQIQDGAEIDFHPYLIVPANADFRLRSAASGSNTEVSAWVNGILMTTGSPRSFPGLNE